MAVMLTRMRDIFAQLSEEVLNSEVESVIIIAATQERSGIIRYNICREHAANLMAAMSDHIGNVAEEEKKPWDMPTQTKH